MRIPHNETAGTISRVQKYKIFCKNVPLNLKKMIYVL